MALCRWRRMLSTFEMTDTDGEPDRLSRMMVSLHHVLFWMFFVIGSSAMLTTNSAHELPLVLGINPMLTPVESAGCNA